jgi:dihydroorotate dehydrogenase
MYVWPTIRSCLFCLDAEYAHNLSLRLLPYAPLPRLPTSDPRLAISIAGLHLTNPIGLAAGFDKNAFAVDALLRCGFGFVEVGTLTPRAQIGNPKPRLFRLKEDRGVINRMGFNNVGQTDALNRLSVPRSGIVGVNIGANKDTANRVDDYVQGIEKMSPVADYVTINISSPNTPGLRDMQDSVLLCELLEAVSAARTQAGRPVFLKIAPDLPIRQIDAIARLTMTNRIDALIVANTTVTRPHLSSRYAQEKGGLSGIPLNALALRCLRDFHTATGGQLPLIASGGVSSGADAYSRILAGASLVQIYSALVYEGPALVGRINAELLSFLERDGHATLASAVGQGMCESHSSAS